MDLDFWWLLVIPVAFALGWMASRYDLKTLLSENANLPRSYFRGLNFLLNEQHDKAIDAWDHYLCLKHDADGEKRISEEMTGIGGKPQCKDGAKTPAKTPTKTAPKKK